MVASRFEPEEQLTGSVKAEKLVTDVTTEEGQRTNCDQMSPQRRGKLLTFFASGSWLMLHG